MGPGLSLKLKKRYYIMFVSRDEDGNLNKVPVPLHYAYIFVAAAAIGMFTITGLAGSYSRMLIKTARFNQLRQDHNTLQKDYAHLEEAAHEKDIQAASLGSLANEVSALYGLTARGFFWVATSSSLGRDPNCFLSFWLPFFAETLYFSQAALVRSVR